MRIAVPPAVVLAADMFDQFLAENNLQDFALHCDEDAEIQHRFLDATLPAALQDDLKAFLEEVHYPLAVRSSSLLEDSQYQPFTGVYETFMLGNERADITLRLAELNEAIKRVYASTFSRHAKAYVRATPYRLEEEKMAVILQQIVGTMHGQRFYPDFSGVVRSHNFYPVPPMTYADGIAAVALGRAGRSGWRQVPELLPALSAQSAAVFFGRRHSGEFTVRILCPGIEWRGAPRRRASARDALHPRRRRNRWHAPRGRFNVFRRQQRRIRRSQPPGVRVVSFAAMLKHGTFPLATILEMLVRAGEDALGNPVEIEFAVRLPRVSEEVAEFGFLQIRPLTFARDNQELDLGKVEPDVWSA